MRRHRTNGPCFNTDIGKFVDREDDDTVIAVKDFAEKYELTSTEVILPFDARQGILDGLASGGPLIVSLVVCTPLGMLLEPIMKKKKTAEDGCD